MIKVLIIEDNQYKIKVLRALLDKQKGVVHYDVGQDAVEARRFLQSSFYDLLILDLNIPKRPGDDPKAENSIDLLKELNQGSRLVKPSHIIGLTEYDELREKYQGEFESYLWLVILYDLKSVTWENQLVSKIEYLVKAKTTAQISAAEQHQVDLAFVTALRTPELEFVLKQPVLWEAFKLPNDPDEYHRGQLTLGGKKISIIAVSSVQMGMVASASLTMKVIHAFRPRYIVMTGMAAGIEGKSNYGDILITESAFDYTSGKETLDESGKAIFQPDFKPITVARELQVDIQSCKSNRTFLDEIRNGWDGEKPSSSIEIHFGPLGSGGGVIENTSVLQNVIQHNRKLIGVDMETYGLYYSADICSKPRPKGVISIKAVSDFANKQKDDRYQKYSSYVSAKFAFRFFTEKVLLPELQLV